MSNQTFNVTVHTSAHFYRNYVIAFFLKHFKNIMIHDWDHISSDTYIHCIVLHYTNMSHVNKHVRPHTKLIFISGEPFEMFGEHVHLLLHCLRQKQYSVPALYLPFYVVSFAERFAHPRELLVKPPLDDLLKTKTKFCAFMYSNPVEFRDRFFDVMARQYKSPDALGSCRSGKTVSQTNRMLYDLFVKTHYEDAVEQYRPYKFVIAIENSRLNGYISEKLMNPVLANAVPIYLGAPDIFADGVLNPKAIIHIADFKSYEDCVHYVKKVDNDLALYRTYVEQPIFIGNKLPRYFDSNYILSSVLQVFNTPAS